MQRSAPSSGQTLARTQSALASEFRVWLEVLSTDPDLAHVRQEVYHLATSSNPTFRTFF